MGMNKARLGFILGIIVALLIGTADIPGLARNGQICMALSFMTVIFWGFQITQPGYTSGLYLLLLAVFGVEKPALIFSTWTGPMMFLIVGAYLIAGAVKESGLGERIAYKFIISYVTSFKSIIVAIFILTFILSLLIPHPWPRAFLIMSVMAVVIKSANIPRVDAVKIGFTVFAASVPVSLIFLTGDATISPLAVQSSGVSLGWLGWFKLMGPPSIIVSIITCFMILFLFKPTQEVQVNKEEMRAKLAAMGPMSGKELRTAFWVTLAIILWMTDTLHGVDIGWVTLFIATISIIIHMLLGSVIAVMGIIIPAMITFTSQMGITPLVPALLAYSAVASHYVLPFQHLNMLVGLGEDNGMYSQKETIRLGIPFIIVIYVMTVLIEVPYWSMLGLFDK